MKTRNRYIHNLSLLGILLIVLLAVACSRNNDSQRREQLSSLDDSVSTKSKQARKLIEEAMGNATDSISYYEFAARLAKYYMLSATPDSAIPIVDKTVRFIGNPKTPREHALLAYVYNIKGGYLHIFHKDTKSSIDIYGKAYSLIMNSDEKDQAPNVCANIADAYVYENELPEAANWYRRALFLSDSLNMKNKENLSFYVGLALIYQQLGDDNRALNLYKKADSRYGEMPVSMQAYFLNNYASFYYYKKDYKKSLEIFKRMENHLLSHGMADNFDMYLCKINLADVYLNLKDYNLAEKYLDEVEPFWKANGDPTAIYYCSSIRLGIDVAKGNLSKAATLISNDSTSATVMSGMRQIRNRYMREYFEKTGNWKAAYENLKSDEAENDSLEHNRTNMRAADIVTQYTQDTLKLHNDLRMELKEAEVGKTRLWLVITISVAVVLLLIVLLMEVRAHRRKLRTEMRVMQLRLESARNRISPHFVFNVLNNRIVGAEHKEADELFDLSKLIRANLDMASNMAVTLSDELDFVEKYVKVESKLLPNDDFKYNVDIDENINTKEILVPSMSIQILVENAFVHALMGRKEHKELTVSVHHENNATRLAVTDNGPGFDIRSSRHRSRTGLNVIRQTIAIINERNKQRIDFSLHNKTNAEGKTLGCEAVIIIPDGIKYPS